MTSVGDDRRHDRDVTLYAEADEQDEQEDRRDDEEAELVDQQHVDDVTEDGDDESEDVPRRARPRRRWRTTGFAPRGASGRSRSAAPRRRRVRQQPAPERAPDRTSARESGGNDGTCTSTAMPSSSSNGAEYGVVELHLSVTARAGATSSLRDAEGLHHRRPCRRRPFAMYLPKSSCGAQRRRSRAEPGSPCNPCCRTPS